MAAELFPLPEPDTEARLAHWLLGRETDLDRKIVIALLGTPQRYRDLRSLVGGKSDTPLTRSLHRLGEKGLIRQGMNLDDPGEPRYYAVTPLGVLVALKMHEFVPIERTLEEARRAGVLGS